METIVGSLDVIQVDIETSVERLRKPEIQGSIHFDARQRKHLLLVNYGEKKKNCTPPVYFVLIYFFFFCWSDEGQGLGFCIKKQSNCFFFL